MKNKSLYIILASLACFFAACEKDPVIEPSVLTTEEVKIESSYTKADITWSFHCDASVSYVVFEYGTDSTFTNFSEETMSIISGGDLSEERQPVRYQSKISLNSLSRGTTYYFRMKVSNNYSTYQSEYHSFSTGAYSNTVPKVQTDSLSEIFTNSVQAHATLLDWGSDKKPVIGFCYATHPDVNINDMLVTVTVNEWTDVVSFTKQVPNLTAFTTYYIRAFATNDKGTGYGEEISFKTTVDFVSGLFSVSANKQVRFSKGNLQYNATLGTHQCSDGSSKPGTWRFAGHQYDVVGGGNANASASYSGWIDLFGFGTSGKSCQPYSTESETKYYINASLKSNSESDWGVYNAISNGGNEPRQWRTLTRDEWAYVFDTRGGRSSYPAPATVCGVHGWILLPDDTTAPEGISFEANAANEWATNVYDAEQWAQMEMAGIVFLPTGGQRKARQVSGVGRYGCYWSTTQEDYLGIGTMYLMENYRSGNRWYDSYYGHSVRLVQDVQ